MKINFERTVVGVVFVIGILVCVIVKNWGALVWCVAATIWWINSCVFEDSQVKDVSVQLLGNRCIVKINGENCLDCYVD